MKVKTIGLIFFSLAFLFNVAAMGKDIDLPKEIFKHWVHSYEEDTEEFSVYRPVDYNFPPARGRGGFEIKEDGKFILYSIAPACGIDEFYGYWKAEDENTIIGYFEKDAKAQQMVLNIVTCSNDILKVKKKMIIS